MGFCDRNASNKLPSNKIAPTAAANNPSRLPVFDAGRERSSMRSELRSCCGGIELLIGEFKNPLIYDRAVFVTGIFGPGSGKLTSVLIAGARWDTEPRNRASR